MKNLFFLLSLLAVWHTSNSQNVGIGTTIPKARLHVADSSVVFSAAALLTNGNPPISGPGTRMMWYAYKAAFRAGYASAAEWDNNNVGQYSVATGYATKASGSYPLRWETTRLLRAKIQPQWVVELRQADLIPLQWDILARHLMSML